MKGVLGVNSAALTLSHELSSPGITGEPAKGNTVIKALASARDFFVVDISFPRDVYSFYLSLYEYP